jgi:cyclopropane fatty-acyl-phospholipid synthase-like methyltransferase
LALIQDGAYAFPNGEPERDRLDLQHHLCTLTFEGKLFTAPIPKEQQLHRVLDVGTGTGIWAIDLGDEHPEAHVYGIDLSPTQPTLVPQNVTFEIDDLEEPWTFTTKFDLIYSRMMVASFASFLGFFEQSFENLVPGGWIEMVDICSPIQADDDSLPEDSALRKWYIFIARAVNVR